MSGIIQLQNTEGEALGLYQYDEEQYTAEAAIQLIETVFATHADSDDVQEAADAVLELRYQIARVHADLATTTAL